MTTATNTNDARDLAQRDAEWLADFGHHYFGAAKSGKVHKPEYRAWISHQTDGHRHFANAACNPRTRLDSIHTVAYGETISGDICQRCFREADGWEVK